MATVKQIVRSERFIKNTLKLCDKQYNPYLQDTVHYFLEGPCD